MAGECCLRQPWSSWPGRAVALGLALFSLSPVALRQSHSPCSNAPGINSLIFRAQRTPLGAIFGYRRAIFSHHRPPINTAPATKPGRTFALTLGSVLAFLGLHVLPSALAIGLAVRLVRRLLPIIGVAHPTPSRLVGTAGLDIPAWLLAERFRRYRYPYCCRHAHRRGGLRSERKVVAAPFSQGWAGGDF